MASIFNENERKLRRLRKIATQVDMLATKYKTMDEKDLIAETERFKKELAEGKTLDDILPEAFATVREAARRMIQLYPFFVQIMGGIALHQGRIAEMGTGEGKTLVATMPAYLNALAGKGVHIVTVNEYLARRDAAWMGKVFRYLGLTVGVITHDMKFEEKVRAYNCDITYCTNNELGFDFLRDNMVVSKSRKVQRGLDFAIVDEVDSILIDEARTPLIISGKGGRHPHRGEGKDRRPDGQRHKQGGEIFRRREHHGYGERRDVQPHRERLESALHHAEGPRLHRRGRRSAHRGRVHG